MNHQASIHLLPVDGQCGHGDKAVNDQLSSENCQLCKFSSSYIGKLTEHYKEVHYLHYCIICKIKCRSKFHLDKHFKATHGLDHVIAGNKELLSNLISELRAKMGYAISCDSRSRSKRCYTCNHCDKKVTDRSHIITHIRIHTGEQPFECVKCNFKSAYRQTIQRHKELCHSNLPPPRPFSCSKCEKSFKTKQIFRKHQLVHSSSKQFSCKKCSYATNRKQHLKEHLLDKHSNFPEELLKPHGCEVCGFRFKCSNHLIRHLKVHNRDSIKSYLYKCEYCDASFTEKYNLRAHIDIKHKQKPPKHICGVCNRRFHGKRDLERHAVIHQSDPVLHHCSECDFKSKHVQSLVRHNKVKHSDTYEPKKYPCDVCSKDFKSKAKLKRHSYIHKGKLEKPIACSECNYRCIEKSGLKRHMKVVHGSPPSKKSSILDSSC